MLEKIMYAMSDLLKLFSRNNSLLCKVLRPVNAGRLFILLSFLLSANSYAELIIPDKHWGRQEVLYFIDKPSCPQIVMDQFPGVFEGADRFIRFLEGGIRRTIGYDEMPTIFCDPDDTRLGTSDLSHLPDGIQVTEYDIKSEVNNAVTLASARVYSSYSGAIMDADIWIDSDFIHESNINYVLKHEIGHLLGLPHSNDPDALMYWKPTARTWNITDYAMFSMAYTCTSQLDDRMNEFVVHRYGRDWLYIIKAFNGRFFNVQDYGILTDTEMNESNGCRHLIR